MDENNLLLTALDVRWRKLQKEWDRTRRKYSESAVHDLRVASRRLIAVLETLRDLQDHQEIRDCRRRVKKILDGLSPLRDLHVQRMSVAKMARSYPQLKNFEKSLAGKEERTAGKVQKQLKQNPRIDRAIDRAARHAIKQVSEDTVRTIVDRRYRNVLGLADRIDPADTATIHQMRLAFKKFRYTCEVAQPIIKKDVSEGLLKQLHAFQTMMGDIQDIEVLSARLTKWATKNDRGANLQPVFDELKVERERRIATFTASLNQLHTFWQPVSHE
jgi:CHAD domain-containing protein